VPGKRLLSSHRSIIAAAAWWVALAVAVAAQGASSPGVHAAPDASRGIALADLPPEARTVYQLIGRGGPFAYDRDGVVFGNREHLLPAKPRGYYHEYTVRTPGEKTRGARRIVCGGPATKPEACYYTHDHYQSFRRIRE
jgi:ribonuclease T1